MLMTVGIGMYMHVADHDNYKLELVIGEYTLGYFKDHIKVSVCILFIKTFKCFASVLAKDVKSSKKTQVWTASSYREFYLFFCPYKIIKATKQ